MTEQEARAFASELEGNKDMQVLRVYEWRPGDWGVEVRGGWRVTITSLEEAQIMRQKFRDARDATERNR